MATKIKNTKPPVKPASGKSPIATLTNDPDLYVMTGSRLSNPNNLLSHLGRRTDLFDEMRRDPAIAGPLQVRLEALAGLPWKIIPASEDPADIERAEQLQEQIEGIANFADGLAHLNLACSDGISGAEMIGGTRSEYVIDYLNFVSSYRFTFDAEYNLFLRTKESPNDGIAVPREKFILSINGRPPFGDGILSTLYWIWFYGRNVFKDELVWLNRRAVESIIAIASDQQVDDDLTDLVKHLENLQNNSVGAFPNGTTIETLELGRETTRNIFEAFANRKDRVAQRMILGGELTGMSGQGTGSFALGRIHESIRDDLLQSDARKREQEINNQLVPLIARGLWLDWDRIILPHYTFDLELEMSADEMLKRAQTAETKFRAASLLGVHLVASDVYDTLGLVMPPDMTGEEIIVAQPAPAAPSYPFQQKAKPIETPTHYNKAYLVGTDALRNAHFAKQNTIVAVLVAAVMKDADAEHKAISDALKKAVKNALNFPQLRGAADKIISPELLASLAKKYGRHIGKAAVAGAEDVRRKAIADARKHETNAGLSKLWSHVTMRLASTVKIGDVTIDLVLFTEAADIWVEAGYYASAITKYRLGEALTDAIRAAIEQGEDFRDFQDRIVAALGESGVDALKPGYLELVYNMNLSNAYRAGRYAQMQQPGMSEMFPAMEYITARDGHVRPEHAIHEGKIYMPDSPVWNLQKDWGCRCGSIAVNKYDLESGKYTITPTASTGRTDWVEDLKTSATNLGAI